MEQLDLTESGKRKTESGTRDESGIRGIRDERGKRKAESGWELFRAVQKVQSIHLLGTLNADRPRSVVGERRGLRAERDHKFGVGFKLGAGVDTDDQFTVIGAYPDSSDGFYAVNLEVNVRQRNDKRGIVVR